MSVDSVLDEALTILLAKARSDHPDQARAITTRSATLNYQFGDGVTPIVLTNEGPKKLSVPYPSRIVWARLCAGDASGAPVAVTATVDVQLTSFVAFGAFTPLWGTGTIPTITAASAVDCNLTGWQINLVTGDWLIARLASITGSATWLALELLIRSTSDDIGVETIVDTGAGTVVDSNGNPVVLRT